MQNPMRFIDFGLEFSPVEMSLIKVIKIFFPCLNLTYLKADSSTAVACSNAVICLLARLQRLLWPLAGIARGKLSCYLVIPFLPEEISQKVSIASFSHYYYRGYGGRKILMNCVLHSTLKTSSFRSQIAWQRGYEFRIKVFSEHQTFIASFGMNRIRDKGTYTLIFQKQTLSTNYL